MMKGLFGSGYGAILAAMSGFQRTDPIDFGAPRRRQLPKPAAPVNGDGKRLKRKKHPRHGARLCSPAYRLFAEKVRATHSDKPDPRHDEYLHSHARSARAFNRDAEARG